MNLIYNSEQYSVVEFSADGQHETLRFGGYEIMDKSKQRETFINGPAAELFRRNVQDLIEMGPTMEDIDEFLNKYAPIMQNPVNLH